MAAFLLYHKKTRPTGRVIAEGLGIAHGADPDNLPTDTTKVIRWGNAKAIHRPSIEFVNQARAIMLAGDKLATLQRLAEENVPHVEFSLRPPEGPSLSTVWFGRRKRGFGGHDIVAINHDGRLWIPGEGGFDSVSARAKFQACEFFTKWVENNREYRIHVVNGEIVRYQRKYPTERAQQTGGFVRVQNHKNGYIFKQPEKRLNRERTDACIAAVEALGLDFGAVDMIVDSDTSRGITRILEVNTAPSCSPKTAEAYVNAFREVLQ